MRVRDWRDILDQVAEEASEPDGWRAVSGRRREGVGEDLFLGHPDLGVYQLKTYAKNPYDVRGVGARVARKVDGDVDSLLPNREDDAGRFAVRTAPEDEDAAERMTRRLEETVRVHADAPTTPEDFFTDLMEAVESPAFGPMEYDGYDRPDRLDDLAGTFEEAEAVLNAEFDDLVADDGVDRGFQ
ncbi:hypothetical protein [Halegenticoccus tardaugens]|uniref:hypothetical protein n=1 Tax=Halegenticoccus tardaugens TaxID=2071624 RepID=UPI00100B1744|nr:hypothetical protein [Halegenticoccus tardaugens]